MQDLSIYKIEKVRKLFTNLKVKWAILTILFIISIVSSHFIFSTRINFENDIAISYKSGNNNKVDKFKIPVFDIEAKQQIVSLNDYRHSKGAFVVLHPENNIKIKKSGLNCKLVNLNNDIYI